MGKLPLTRWDTCSHSCRFCACAVAERTEAGRRTLAQFGNPPNPEPLLFNFFCVQHGEWTDQYATCQDWCDPEFDRPALSA